MALFRAVLIRSFPSHYSGLCTITANVKVKNANDKGLNFLQTYTKYDTVAFSILSNMADTSIKMSGVAL